LKIMLGKMSSFLDRIATAITVALMAFLSVLFFISVFWRFVLDSPLEWQYETTLLCLSWVVFIGMSMTFRAKEHMALTFVTNALAPKVRLKWLNVIDAVCIVFLIVGIFSGTSVVKSTWSNYYLTLPFIRKSFFYLAFPIGCAISVIHLIYNICTRDLASVAVRGSDNAGKPAKKSKEG